MIEDMFGSFFIIRVVFVQKILKEKDLQYRKHNEKFDEDDHPYFPPPARHISESIIIKTKQPAKQRKISFHLCLFLF